jgi:hypothetical protein
MNLATGFWVNPDPDSGLDPSFFIAKSLKMLQFKKF